MRATARALALTVLAALAAPAGAGQQAPVMTLDSGIRLAVAPVRASSAPGVPLTAELGRGKFLVAGRTLRDPNFSRTVVLLLEHDDSGALGLVVNRPTDITLASVLPDVDELGGRPDLLYLGGPVSRDHLVLLIRSDTAPEGSKAVLDDVFVSANLDTLRALVGAAGAEPFHAYAGYAGWAAGQLEGEVSRGDWHIAPADAETVFEQRAEDVWPDLIRRNTGRWVRRGMPRAAALRAAWRPR